MPLDSNGIRRKALFNNILAIGFSNFFKLKKEEIERISGGEVQRSRQQNFC